MSVVKGACEGGSHCVQGRRRKGAEERDLAVMGGPDFFFAVYFSFFPELSSLSAQIQAAPCPRLT